MRFLLNKSFTNSNIFAKYIDRIDITGK